MDLKSGYQSSNILDDNSIQISPNSILTNEVYRYSPDDSRGNPRFKRRIHKTQVCKFIIIIIINILNMHTSKCIVN